MDILLNKCGSFYETYDDSAERLSGAMSLTNFFRGVSERPVAGFPVASLDRYLDELEDQGLKVFVIDNADQQPWSRTQRVADSKERLNRYQLVFSAFEKFHAEIGSIEDKLQKLRPRLIDLRREYTSPSVRPTYEGAFAWAYLLAYVPPYAFLTEHVLRKIDFFEEFTSGNLEISIVGVGPGPEMVAVQQIFSERSGGESMLSFHLYDTNHSAWSEVRSALSHVAAEFFGIHKQQHIAVHLDFNQPIDQQDLHRWFGGTKYLIFQNVLNEITNHEIAVHNFREIWEVLGEGSRILIVDQNVNIYPQTRLLWNRIKTFVESHGSGEVTELREETIRFTDEVPPSLEKHLFDVPNLWDRRKIKFGLLMFQKGATS
jgi:hypothetical protein